MSRRSLLLTLLLLLLAPLAFAVQNNLAWDQGAPDAATAQGYIYRIYIDGGSQGQILTNVVCSGTTTITCQTPFPSTVNGAPVPSGPHPVVISTQPNAATGVEVLSVSTTFQVPGQSGNLRVK